MGMASANVHCTNATDKQISYANNSSLQNKVLLKTRPMLKDTIKDMLSKIFPVTCIKLADLGCASGPDAFLPTYEIMNTITGICQQSHSESPELQVFLNDLSHNDFNTVFRSIPAFHARLLEDKRDLRGPCFITGIAGSFYQRLFPNKTIHFAHSSYCLHWLSKVPKGDLLAKSLLDLVDKGLVNESDVDSFNTPYYYPCEEEPKKIIKNEGSFVLDKIKTFKVN
ncbi:hypothetical protein V6N13_139406 [Hibiscus sabdariffa]|uniref:Uncharacterized protein n=1 Tax=Hibiscus sabdariffa TaxID=183260 RepID=A0ABR2C8X0_9ROSI